VDPAVISKSSNGVERDREGEPVVVDARIKYPVRIIRRAGRDAVIIGNPGPIDDIAGADGNRARVKVGPALSHVHIRRSRLPNDWQQNQKDERQSEIHFEDFRGRAIRVAG
jgi:hypothetical protein